MAAIHGQSRKRMHTEPNMYGSFGRKREGSQSHFSLSRCYCYVSLFCSAPGMSDLYLGFAIDSCLTF